MPARSPEEADVLCAEGFNAGDVDAVVALYESGAAFVLPDGEVISGADTIRKTLNEYLTMKPRIDLRTKKIVEAGDVALVFSGWTLTATAPDGSAVDMAGDATVALRRQPDGTWLLAIDDPGWKTG